MPDIRQAIGAGNAKFMAAFQSGDVAGVAACYTADARLLPPGGEMMIGAENIQAFWQGAMAMGIKAATLETVEVEHRGDLAIEIGRYTLNIQPEGGAAMTDNGKYIVVWKEDGGVWKLHFDIWNTSVAA